MVGGADAAMLPSAQAVLSPAVTPPRAVIQLNMPELHVVGAAEVLAVSACRPIDPGNGPVVISTFKNTADNILNIYVEGETEPIGVTAGHPIWSEDRQDFVHSEKLQPGERLRSAVGRTVRITSIEIRAGPEPVYNLEVASEHVYSVTDSGLLVHNTGSCGPQLYQVTGGAAAPRGTAGRLAELRGKYGDRFRLNMMVDVVSDRDAAFATVKSVRRQVEKVMKADPRMIQLLKDGVL